MAQKGRQAHEEGANGTPLSHASASAFFPSFRPLLCSPRLLFSSVLFFIFFSIQTCHLLGCHTCSFGLLVQLSTLSQHYLSFSQRALISAYTHPILPTVVSVPTYLTGETRQMSHNPSRNNRSSAWDGLSLHSGVASLGLIWVVTFFVF